MLPPRSLDKLSAQLLDTGGKRGEVSRHSVHTYMRAINRFLTWAKEGGEEIDARAQLPKLPKQLIDVLSRDEIQTMEGAAKTKRDKLIIRILADTGIRVGELVGLRTTDASKGTAAFTSDPKEMVAQGAPGPDSSAAPSPAAVRRAEPAS